MPGKITGSSDFSQDLQLNVIVKGEEEIARIKRLLEDLVSVQQSATRGNNLVKYFDDAASSIGKVEEAYARLKRAAPGKEMTAAAEEFIKVTNAFKVRNGDDAASMLSSIDAGMEDLLKSCEKMAPAIADAFSARNFQQAKAMLDELKASGLDVTEVFSQLGQGDVNTLSAQVEKLTSRLEMTEHRLRSTKSEMESLKSGDTFRELSEQLDRFNEGALRSQKEFRSFLSASGFTGSDLDIFGKFSEQFDGIATGMKTVKEAMAEVREEYPQMFSGANADELKDVLSTLTEVKQMVSEINRVSGGSGGGSGGFFGGGSGGSGGSGGPGDFDDKLQQIINHLAQINDALSQVSTTLGTIGQGGANGIEQITGAMQQLVDIVNELNSKDFSIQNVFQSGDAEINAANGLRAYREEAVALNTYLISLSNTIADAGSSSRAFGRAMLQMREQLDIIGDFNADKIKRQIMNAKDLSALDSIIVQLNEYRKAMDQVIETGKQMGVEFAMPDTSSLDAARQKVAELTHTVEQESAAVSEAATSAEQLSNALSVTEKGLTGATAQELAGAFETLKSTLETIRGQIDTAFDLQKQLADVQTLSDAYKQLGDQISIVNQRIAEQSAGGAGGNASVTQIADLQREVSELMAQLNDALAKITNAFDLSGSVSGIQSFKQELAEVVGMIETIHQKTSETTTQFGTVKFDESMASQLASIAKQFTEIGVSLDGLRGKITKTFDLSKAVSDAERLTEAYKEIKGALELVRDLAKAVNKQTDQTSGSATKRSVEETTEAIEKQTQAWYDEQAAWREAQDQKAREAGWIEAEALAKREAAEQAAIDRNLASFVKAEEAKADAAVTAATKANDAWDKQIAKYERTLDTLQLGSSSIKFGDNSDAVQRYTTALDAARSALNNVRNATKENRDVAIAAYNQEIESVRKLRNELNSMYGSNATNKQLESFKKQWISFTQSNSSWYSKNKTAYDEIWAAISSGAQMSSGELQTLQTNFLSMNNAMSIARAGGKSFFDEMKAGWKKFGGWSIVTRTFTSVIRVMKQAVQSVKEVDAAMVELRKVTRLTEQQYADFYDTAARSSKKIGSSLSDMINATADFARLGYTINEATKLAEAASIYMNVGDKIENMDEATQSIISTMKAFGIEAEDALTIVDKYNEVGNKYAISAAGIGEALQRSSAALAVANNSLEESIGLVVAANDVIQNPEQVGTALKTLTMYLRAAKTEAQEAGIETEGMASSVAKLREQLLQLTNNRLDIMLDENTFKSTYQILKELSEIWDDLADVDQANILSLIGGKRNANVVTSILKNFQDAAAASETAANAAGSAWAENEKYLEGIEGKTKQLKASFQDFSNSVVGSGIVKTVTEIATGILDIATALSKLNLLLPVVVALSTAIRAMKANATANAAASQIGLLFGQGGDLQVIQQQANSVVLGLSNMERKLVAAKLEMAGGSAEVQAYAASLNTAAVSTGAMSTGVEALKNKTQGLGNAFKSLKSSISVWVTIATLVVSAIKSVIDGINEANEKAKQAAKDSYDTYQSSAKEYQGNLQTLLKMQDRFDELSSKIDENKENLGLANDEYSEFMGYVDQIVAISPSVVSAYTDQGYTLKTKYVDVLNEAIGGMRALAEESEKAQANTWRNSTSKTEVEEMTKAWKEYTDTAKQGTMGTMLVWKDIFPDPNEATETTREWINAWDQVLSELDIDPIIVDLEFNPHDWDLNSPEYERVYEWDKWSENQAENAQSVIEWYSKVYTHAQQIIDRLRIMTNEAGQPLFNEADLDKIYHGIVGRFGNAAGAVQKYTEQMQNDVQNLQLVLKYEPSTKGIFGEVFDSDYYTEFALGMSNAFSVFDDTETKVNKAKAYLNEFYKGLVDVNDALAAGEEDDVIAALTDLQVKYADNAAVMAMIKSAMADVTKETKQATEATTELSKAYEDLSTAMSNASSASNLLKKLRDGTAGIEDIIPELVKLAEAWNKMFPEDQKVWTDFLMFGNDNNVDIAATATSVEGYIDAMVDAAFAGTEFAASHSDVIQQVKDSFKTFADASSATFDLADAITNFNEAVSLIEEIRSGDIIGALQDIMTLVKSGQFSMADFFDANGLKSAEVITAEIADSLIADMRELAEAEGMKWDDTWADSLKKKLMEAGTESDKTTDKVRKLTDAISDFNTGVSLIKNIRGNDLLGSLKDIISLVESKQFSIGDFFNADGLKSDTEIIDTIADKLISDMRKLAEAEGIIWNDSWSETLKNNVKNAGEEADKSADKVFKLTDAISDFNTAVSLVKNLRKDDLFGSLQDIISLVEGGRFSMAEFFDEDGLKSAEKITAEIVDVLIENIQELAEAEGMTWNDAWGEKLRKQLTDAASGADEATEKVFKLTDAINDFNTAVSIVGSIREGDLLGSLQSIISLVEGGRFTMADFFDADGLKSAERITAEIADVLIENLEELAEAEGMTWNSAWGETLKKQLTDAASGADETADKVRKLTNAIDEFNTTLSLIKNIRSDDLLGSLQNIISLVESGQFEMADFFDVDGLKSAEKIAATLADYLIENLQELAEAEGMTWNSAWGETLKKQLTDAASGADETTDKVRKLTDAISEFNTTVSLIKNIRSGDLLGSLQNIISLVESGQFEMADFFDVDGLKSAEKISATLADYLIENLEELAKAEGMVWDDSWSEELKKQLTEAGQAADDSSNKVRKLTDAISEFNTAVSLIKSIRSDDLLGSLQSIISLVESGQFTMADFFDADGLKSAERITAELADYLIENIEELAKAEGMQWDDAWGETLRKQLAEAGQAADDSSKKVRKLTDAINEFNTTVSLIKNVRDNDLLGSLQNIISLVESGQFTMADFFDVDGLKSAEEISSTLADYLIENLEELAKAEGITWNDSWTETLKEELANAGKEAEDTEKKVRKLTDAISEFNTAVSLISNIRSGDLLGTLQNIMSLVESKKFTMADFFDADGLKSDTAIFDTIADRLINNMKELAEAEGITWEDSWTTELKKELTEAGDAAKETKDRVYELTDALDALSNIVSIINDGFDMSDPLNAIKQAKELADEWNAAREAIGKEPNKHWTDFISPDDLVSQFGGAADIIREGSQQIKEAKDDFVEDVTTDSITVKIPVGAKLIASAGMSDVSLMGRDGKLDLEKLVQDFIPDNYNGNVDLTNRKIIPIDILTRVGWKNHDGTPLGEDYATIFTNTFSAGDTSKGFDIEYDQNIVCNITPILADGTVLSPRGIEDYFYDIVQEASKSGKSIMEVDAEQLSLVFSVDIVEEGMTLDEAYEKAGDFAWSLHEMQAEWDNVRFENNWFGDDSIDPNHVFDKIADQVRDGADAIDDASKSVDQAASSMMGSARMIASAGMSDISFARANIDDVLDAWDEFAQQSADDDDPLGIMTTLDGIMGATKMSRTTTESLREMYSDIVDSFIESDEQLKAMSDEDKSVWHSVIMAAVDEMLKANDLKKKSQEIADSFTRIGDAYTFMQDHAAGDRVSNIADVYDELQQLRDLAGDQTIQLSDFIEWDDDIQGFVYKATTLQNTIDEVAHTIATELVDAEIAAGNAMDEALRSEEIEKRAEQIKTSLGGVADSWNQLSTAVSNVKSIRSFRNTLTSGEGDILDMLSDAISFAEDFGIELEEIVTFDAFGQMVFSADALNVALDASIDKLVEEGVVAAELAEQLKLAAREQKQMETAQQTIGNSYDTWSSMSGSREYVDAQQITYSQYQKLIEADERYATALQYSNGQLSINAQRYNEVTAAIGKETIAVAKLRIEENKKKIGKLVDEYKSLSNTQSDRAKAIMQEIKKLALETQGYAVLATEIDGATSAMNRFLNASSNINDSSYDAATEAFKVIKDTLYNTESEMYMMTGREQFKEAMKFVLGDNVEFNDEGFEKAFKAAERYLENGRQGLQNFVDDLFSFNIVDSEGNLNMSLEEISSKLGISKDAVASLLKQLNQLEGFDIDLSDEAGDATEDVKSWFDQLTDLMSTIDGFETDGIDFSVSETTQTALDTLQQQLEAIDATIQAINAGITGASGKTPTTADQEDSITTDVTTTVTTTGAEESAAALTDVQEAADSIPEQTTTEVTEEGAAGLIASLKEVIDLENTASAKVVAPSSSSSGLSAVNSSLAGIISKINMINNMTVQPKGGKANVPGLWSGTMRAEGGNTLVGELGQEMVVDIRNGRYYTVGTNGPEIINVPKDAIVYNHIMTAQLLGRNTTSRVGARTVKGQSRALGDEAGRALATGTISPIVPGAEPPKQRPVYQGVVKEAEELEDIFEKIKEKYEAINKDLEHLIKHLEHQYDVNERALNYNGMAGVLAGEAKRYQEIIDNCQKGIRDLLAHGADDSNEQVQDLEETMWSAYQSMYDALDKIRALYVDALNDEIDRIQSAYSSLYDAISEYNTNGKISLDTFQALLENGIQYLSLLKNENGQYNINEQSVQKLIKARKNQLAIETALAYISRIKEALQNNEVNKVNELINATQAIGSTTWSYVYAQAALLKAQGLSNEQYEQLIQNLHNLQELTDVVGEDTPGVGVSGIKDQYEALNKELEHYIEHQEQIYKESDRASDYSGMEQALRNKVSYWQQVIANSQAALEEMKAAGATDLDENVQAMERAIWEAQENINEAMDAIRSLLTDALSNRLKDIESAFSTMSSAVSEFNDNGHISLSTFQSLINGGIEYLGLLKKENDQYVLNEDAIKAMIAARKEQLAIESALSYISRLREALQNGETEKIKQLTDLSEKLSQNSWSVVYAELEQLRALGLSDEQYQRIIENVQALQQIAADVSLGSADPTKEDVLDEILNKYAELNDQIEHYIKHQEFVYKQAERALDYDGMVGSLTQQVAYYDEIMRNAMAGIEEMKAEGADDTDAALQNLEETYWSAYESVKDTLKSIRDLKVDALTDQIDDLQGAFKNLESAAKEYNERGGITLDTFQTILRSGAQYLSLLDEQGDKYVLSADRVREYIAAEKEHLAIETALSYISNVREALQNNEVERLKNLVDATNTISNSTWSYVYAQAELLREQGLSEDMYEALLHNLQKIESVTASTIDDITSGEEKLSKAYDKQKDALEKILDYTEDLIRAEADDHIDAINDEIDAYKEIIELKKKSLEASKNENEYQEEVAKQVQEIAKLQAKYDLLMLDDSRSAAAERLKIQEELAEKQESLASYQKDNAYNAQVEALDKEAEEYEKLREADISDIEASVSSEEKVYQLAIARIRDQWDTLYADLIAWNTEQGNVINQEITDNWEKAAAAVQQYGSYLEALNALDIASSGTGNIIVADKLPRYHSGGIVGNKGEINDSEVMAILRKGELVIDDEAKSGLYTAVSAVEFLESLGRKIGSAVKNIGTLNPFGAFTPAFAGMATPDSYGYVMHQDVEFNASFNVAVSGVAEGSDAKRVGEQIANSAINNLYDVFNRKGISFTSRLRQG